MKEHTTLTWNHHRLSVLQANLSQTFLKRVTLLQASLCPGCQQLAHRPYEDLVPPYSTSLTFDFSHWIAFQAYCLLWGCNQGTISHMWAHNKYQPPLQCLLSQRNKQKKTTSELCVPIYLLALLHPKDDSTTALESIRNYSQHNTAPQHRTLKSSATLL